MGKLSKSQTSVKVKENNKLMSRVNLWSLDTDIDMIYKLSISY